MSYDLHFWRQDESLFEEPSKVRDSLIEGIPVPGIFELSEEAAKRTFRKTFPDICDTGINWDWEGNDSYFQVSLDSEDGDNFKLLTVNCGFKLLDSTDTMNLIVDAGCSLGCALYDPQTNERYKQSEPENN